MLGQKIMVVDDDPNLRELLIFTLRAAGYEIHAAGDGLTALIELHRRSYDLVILDVMMPEIDGWEVLKLIRDDPDLEDLKVLILTAKDTDRDRMIGTEIFKADEYISKPFNMIELIMTVRMLLEE